jgi:hypothetical protein
METKTKVAVTVVLLFFALLAGATIVCWVAIPRHRDADRSLRSTRDVVSKMKTQIDKMVDEYIEQNRKQRDNNGTILFGHNDNLLMAPKERVYPVRCSTTCLCSPGGMIYYGRYCGFMYTGCSGVEPCDDVDDCCRRHDACTGNVALTDCGCNVAITNCLECAALNILHAKCGYNSTWVCDKKLTAALHMIADIKFLLPDCYERRHQNF